MINGKQPLHLMKRTIVMERRRCLCIYKYISIHLAFALKMTLTAASASLVSNCDGLY